MINDVVSDFTNATAFLNKNIIQMYVYLHNGGKSKRILRQLLKRVSIIYFVNIQTGGNFQQDFLSLL